MSSTGVGATGSIGEIDRCSICLEVTKDPVTPARDYYLFYFFGPKRSAASCTHSFCKDCFEKLKLRSNTCPNCRGWFNNSVPDAEMKKKVELYVKKFGITPSTYFEEDRLSRPTLANATRLMFGGLYQEGIDLTRDPAFVGDKKVAFKYFVTRCIETDNLQILEQNLSKLEGDPFLKGILYLIEQYAGRDNPEKIFGLIKTHSLKYEIIPFPILWNLAFYLTSRESEDKLRDLQEVRHILNCFSNLGGETIDLKDQLLSVLAIKFYELNEIDLAEEQFCKLNDPARFACDVFIKLFEHHITKKEAYRAEFLLQKMGPVWNSEESGYTQQISQARAILKKERAACLMKAKTVGLIALASFGLYYAMNLFSSQSQR